MGAGTGINSLYVSNRRKESRVGEQGGIIVPNLNIKHFSLVIIYNAREQLLPKGGRGGGGDVKWKILNQQMSPREANRRNDAVARDSESPSSRWPHGRGADAVQFWARGCLGSWTQAAGTRRSRPSAFMGPVMLLG